MDRVLVLDSGFRLGGTPLTQLKNKSTFKDFEGDSCTVKNSELFDVKDGKVYYLHATDLQMKAFLKKRCPAISI